MNRAARIIAITAGAAVLAVPASAGAQSTPAVTRVTPKSLSGKSTFKKTSRTLTIRTTGRLTVGTVPKITVCPAGVTDLRYCTQVTPRVCTGFVRVQIKRGNLTISSRRARLRADCTYVGSVTFKRSLNRARGRLVIRPQFGGNTYLTPKTGTRRSLNVGRA